MSIKEAIKTLRELLEIADRVRFDIDYDEKAIRIVRGHKLLHDLEQQKQKDKS